MDAIFYNVKIIGKKEKNIATKIMEQFFMKI